MTEARLKAQIMDAQAMERATTRIAHEIIEHNEGSANIQVIGIIRRGEVLAKRLADAIEQIEGVRPKVGSLDISFYRDDVSRHIAPVVHGTNIPFEIDNSNIVLVDDVLYTGRTVRSALDALMDYGRPKTVQLAVMVDRGHRELPIRADYVGRNVPSSHEEDVRVCIKPLDDHDSVEIWTNPAAEDAKAQEGGAR
ncbi:MAG: bifunctional pyr operon transcriptional regulator/uracil phosphoribosyltransferase PyrR [Tractidigestivibacter sp.]|jgi:pyrimidine operon attenuation protein/uracil phosphoribosyltransferase|uniref:bifunctional pyr operon transcriptional regulator/uracil phosphoribosyltransferase PyrR n=1 Tax=Tractidigestivibacter sp. TaxID=2847320 RepID=UPI003D8F40AD